MHLLVVAIRLADLAVLVVRKVKISTLILAILVLVTFLVVFLEEAKEIPGQSVAEMSRQM